MEIRCIIESPSGNIDLHGANQKVTSDFDTKIRNFSAYFVIVPGSYAWQTGNTSEEGIALQGTSSLRVMDSDNVMSRLLIEQNPYLRGRTATITITGDNPFSTNTRHIMEVDSVRATGADVVISFIAPTASVLTQIFPSEPRTYQLAQAISTVTQTSVRLSGMFTGVVPTTRPFTYTPYYRIGDELVSLPSSLDTRQPAAADFTTTARRGQLGTIADTHGARQELVFAPRSQARAGDLIAGLFSYTGKNLNTTDVRTEFNRWGQLIYMLFTDNVEIGDVLSQITAATGGFIYYDGQAVKGYLPGLTSRFSRIFNTSDIIDSPIPSLNSTTKQYTRAYFKCLRSDPTESDSYTLAATSVNADAESAAQFDRRLEYKRDLTILDSNPSSEQVTNAARNTINFAANRIVSRYALPLRELTLRTTRETSLGDLITVNHPSLPRQTDSYTVISQRGSDTEPYTTITAASNALASITPITGGVHNRTFNIVLRAPMTSVILDDLLSDQALQQINTNLLTGTVRINISGGFTIGGGMGNAERGAIHMIGFEQATSVQITLGRFTTIVGRRGIAAGPYNFNDFFQNGGHCITKHSSVPVVASGSSFRPGGGAGGGYFPPDVYPNIELGDIGPVGWPDFCYGGDGYGWDPNRTVGREGGRTGQDRRWFTGAGGNSGLEGTAVNIIDNPRPPGAIASPHGFGGDIVRII